jgi:hypothetical protein
LFSEQIVVEWLMELVDSRAFEVRIVDIGIGAIVR